jgi:hypothetical protein
MKLIGDFRIPPGLGSFYGIRENELYKAKSLLLSSKGVCSTDWQPVLFGALDPVAIACARVWLRRGMRAWKIGRRQEARSYRGHGMVRLDRLVMARNEAFHQVEIWLDLHKRIRP